jgi:predicted deacylase
MPAGSSWWCAGATPGSAYGAAAQAGIPAIIAEIGGQGIWNDELADRHAEGARRVLQHLGVLPGGEPPALPHRDLGTNAWMRAGRSGLLHPAVAIGETVRKGQTVGRITDYFGRELEQLTAVEDGDILFLVTSLAINEGDPILAIGA